MSTARRIFIVLLLGSYDSQTKSYLELVREEIAKNFSGENVYAFMLDHVNLYFTEDLVVLAESIDKGEATLFIFMNHARVQEVYEVSFKGNLDEKIYMFVKEKYGTTEFTKQSVFQKFDFLMTLAKELLIIRDKEETRGGEYLELMHAIFREHSNKVWLFRRDGVRLSSMLMEYLDRFRVNMRSYSNYSDLKTKIVRLLRNALPS